MQRRRHHTQAQRVADLRTRDTVQSNSKRAMRDRDNYVLLASQRLDELDLARERRGELRCIPLDRYKVLGPDPDYNITCVSAHGLPLSIIELEGRVGGLQVTQITLIGTP